MKEIQLTRGQTAVVDDVDYDYLISFGSWHAMLKTHSGNYYAERWLNFNKKNEKNKKIRIHQLIAESMFGPLEKGIEVDHKNRNTLDNTRENLRLCYRWQNQHNRSGWRNKKSGLPKGVHKTYKSNTFYVELQVNGNRQHKRGFKTIEEAETAYKKWCEELVGEFACHEGVNANR